MIRKLDTISTRLGEDPLVSASSFLSPSRQAAGRDTYRLDSVIRVSHDPLSFISVPVLKETGEAVISSSDLRRRESSRGKLTLSLPSSLSSFSLQPPSSFSFLHSTSTFPFHRPRQQRLETQLSRHAPPSARRSLRPPHSRLLPSLEQPSRETGSFIVRSQRHPYDQPRLQLYRSRSLRPDFRYVLSFSRLLLPISSSALS